MVKRRDILAGFVSLTTLSGCTNLSTGPQKANLPKYVSVSQVDDVTGASLEFQVNMVEPEITSEHTAKLEISVINTSKEDLGLITGSRRVFSEHISEQGNLTLVSRKGNTPQLNEENNCWEVDQLFITQGEVMMDLQPNKAKSEEFRLASPETVSPCFSAGKYRFEQEFVVYDQPNFQSEKIHSFTWGFSLEIANS